MWIYIHWCSLIIHNTYTGVFGLSTDAVGLDQHEPCGFFFLNVPCGHLVFWKGLPIDAVVLDQYKLCM
jgi:hypothetical protein